MPVLLQTLAEIACEKQRDVLHLIFRNPRPKTSAEQEQLQGLVSRLRSIPDWDAHPPRRAVLKWLKQNGIPFAPCYPMLDPGYMSCPYPGDVYLDVPFDRTHPQYQLLEAHLENSDGSMRQEGVWFCYLPLAAAEKNKAEREADRAAEGDDW